MLRMSYCDSSRAGGGGTLGDERLASKVAWAAEVWHSRNNSDFLNGTCTPMYGYRFAGCPPCKLLAR